MVDNMWPKSTIYNQITKITQWNQQNRNERVDSQMGSYY